MPITNSQISGSIKKPGALKKLLMQAVDDLGRVWEHRPIVPIDNDDAATLSAWVAGFQAFSEAYELAKLTSFINTGGSPGDWTRRYISVAQFAETVVRAMMSSRDPLSVMPTAEYIQSEISNSQLQNIFGTQRGTRVRNRSDNLVANKAFLEADELAAEDL